ncbi:MAG: Arc family DNA-binding protein [Rhizobiales bacterium]|nr:Arc family DNA-binding protein [Hyphomicrobiales bacterium]
MSAKKSADKLMVRLPEGLRDRLKNTARENRRSMNAEVIYHLERLLAEPSKTKKAEARA